MPEYKIEGNSDKIAPVFLDVEIRGAIFLLNKDDEVKMKIETIYKYLTYFLNLQLSDKLSLLN